MSGRRIIFFIRFHNYNSQGLKRLYRYFLNFYARRRCLVYSFKVCRRTMYGAESIVISSRKSFWGVRRIENRCLDDCFADILLYRRFPLIFALISAKIVKKSKNINDDERIVWYNKGGQKGAG